MPNRRKLSPNKKDICHTKKPSIIQQKHEELVKMMSFTESEAIIKPLISNTHQVEPEFSPTTRNKSGVKPFTNKLQSNKRRSRACNYMNPKSINDASPNARDGQKKMRNLKADKSPRKRLAERLESKSTKKVNKNTSPKRKSKEIERSYQEKIEKLESTFREKYSSLVYGYNKLLQQEERTAQQNQEKDGQIDRLQAKITILESELSQAHQKLQVKETEH